MEIVTAITHIFSRNITTYDREVRLFIVEIILNTLTVILCIIQTDNLQGND